MTRKLSKKDIEEITQRAPINGVYIPACDNHEGLKGVAVRLRWVCPICGRARGKITKARSYDGSRSFVVDTWDNPCGHVDKYSDVRAEAAENGLNGSEGTATIIRFDYIIKIQAASMRLFEALDTDPEYVEGKVVSANERAIQHYLSLITDNEEMQSKIYNAIERHNFNTSDCTFRPIIADLRALDCEVVINDIRT